MNNIHLKLISPEDHLTDELERINQASFPECERNSITDLFDSGNDGNLDMLGIFTDEQLSGFFTVRKYRKLRYLAYFAVSPDKRCQGIGSAALKKLKEFYPECQIVCEFEAPEDKAYNNDIRLRRKALYLRNGFSSSGWYSFYDETEFEIACTGGELDMTAFQGFITYLNTIVPDHIPDPYKK